MSHNQTSDIIIEQSKKAFEFIQKIEPLTMRKWLVPDRQILSTDWKGVLPPDYVHWISQYGSGRIELISGSITIPCARELTGEDILYDKNNPSDIWRRVYLALRFIPSLRAIDMPIGDDSGLCPVIRTAPYENEKIELVLASSWPMYIIGAILEAIKSLNQKIKDNPGSGKIVWFDDRDPLKKTLTEDQVMLVNELASMSLADIDTGLKKAEDRVASLKKAEIEFLNESSDKSLLDVLSGEETLESIQKVLPYGEEDTTGGIAVDPLEGIVQFAHGLAKNSKNEELMQATNQMAEEIGINFDDGPGSISEAIELIENRINKGFADIHPSASEFLRRPTKPVDKSLLKTLLKHNIAYVRENAREGMLRTCYTDVGFLWLECTRWWHKMTKR